MMRLCSTTLLLVILVAAGGCRFLTSDEIEVPFFIATVDDTELAGTSIGRLSGDELHVWAQFVYPDSTFRFLQFTISEFDGVGVYPLSRRTASYGAIVDEDAIERHGYSSGRQDDVVAIDGYDAGAGIVRGRMFFYSEALIPFGDLLRGDVFSVSGRFRTQIQ